jgi:hypothetical protein
MRQTPWSRALEELTVASLLKKFPAFCGTHNIPTLAPVFIQMIPVHNFTPGFLRLFLILSCHMSLGLATGSFFSVFDKNYVCISPMSHPSTYP